MCWDVGRGRGDVGRGMRGRCRKVCWGVKEVRGDVGRGEGGDVGKYVGAAHPAHFPTPPPFLSPHPFPTRQHTSSLHTLFHTPPHSSHNTLPHFSTSHTSFLTSPHTPTHFPTPPIPLPTASLTSPYTPTHFPTHPMHSPHIFPHSFDYVAKLPCDDITLINLTGLWKSPKKIFTTTRNLKFCFGVGTVNF